MVEKQFRFRRKMWVLAALVALLAACGSETDGAEPPETVSQSASALQTTSAVTGTLEQGTRAAYHFLDDAWAALRGVRNSDCARMRTRLVPRGVFVSASFESGCEIPALGSVSGAVSMTLVVDRGVVTFDVSYASFTIEGSTLTGSTRIAGSNSMATVTMDLTSVVGERSSRVLVDGTVVRDPSALAATIDAAGSYQSEHDEAIRFTVAGLHVVAGACYADAGTLSIGPTTVRFLPSTPNDAAVELTAFEKTATTTLPSYGRCPR